MRQQILCLEPDITPQLHQFVVGHNAEVIDQLKRWQDGAMGECQLYLWGLPGSGKTHLLRALVPDAQYVACHAECRFEPNAAPALAVDDVHQLGAEGAIDLFHRYNERREAGLRLLVSGPCPPTELPLFPDLRSRLAWGLVLRIQPLNDDDKLTALQRHAADLGLDFPEPALTYLLTHCPRNNDYLFGLMRTLLHWSLSTHRASITLPMIREVLDHHDC